MKRTSMHRLISRKRQNGAVIVTVALVTELFRIPLVIHPWTYAFASSIVLIAGVLSGLLVRRKLDHLDLVSVLQSKE